MQTESVAPTAKPNFNGIRNQYRGMYMSMVRGGRWNVHQGSAGYVLLIEGAHMDVPLPVVLRDVQCMTESKMVEHLLYLEAAAKGPTT